MAATSTDAGNLPSGLGQSNELWVLVEADGNDVSVKLSATEGGLSAASACATASLSSFSDDGDGYLGFAGGDVYVDDLAIDYYNGVSYARDFEEGFEVDSAGYALEQLEHDAAGNLTYDGMFAYTYDAWNRQTTAHRAHGLRSLRRRRLA